MYKNEPRPEARPGIKFQNLKKPGPTLYFISKAWPGPMSLQARLFKDGLDPVLPGPCRSLT